METSPVAHAADRRPSAGDRGGDIRTAIELVASGAARRVVLSGIPGVEDLVVEALARAQAAHVAFRLLQAPGAVPAVVVGPRDR